MKTHRIVIVGAGNSVGNHLQAIQAVGDRVDLAAAVDIDEERLRAFCAQYAVPRGYTTVREMLAGEQPDLVCVVTPPETHRDISIECLEAGAWVYCEKPLCASLADFDAIQAAEERTGRYVSTVFQWRFGSAARHLKRLMRAGALGKPLVAICNTLWYRPQKYYSDTWHGRFATDFGGPTTALGIHLMDLLMWLMADWQDVRAITGTLDRQIEVEDVSMALVRFQNGAMGSLVNSVLSPRQESYLRLDFQKATVEVSALYRYSNEHWKISTPADGDDAEMRALWDAMDHDYPGSHDRQLCEILDSMEANQRPPVSGDEARRIIEFTASLYKSAWSGLPVAKGEITPDDAFYYSNNGAGEPAKGS
jgi:predicted dehydrogenase